MNEHETSATEAATFDLNLSESVFSRHCPALLRGANLEEVFYELLV